MVFSYRLLGFLWVTACWNRIDYWIEVFFFVQSVSPKSHQHTNVHYETVNVLYQCKVTFSYWVSLTPFQIYLSSLNCKQTPKERKLYMPSCHNSHIESVFSFVLHLDLIFFIILLMRQGCHVSLQILSCLATLLRKQDLSVWSYPSTLQVYHGLLSFTVHSKPKVSISEPRTSPQHF